MERGSLQQNQNARLTVRGCVLHCPAPAAATYDRPAGGGGDVGRRKRYEQQCLVGKFHCVMAGMRDRGTRQSEIIDSC